LSFRGAMVVRIHPPLQGANLKAARFIALRKHIPGRRRVFARLVKTVCRDLPQSGRRPPQSTVAARGIGPGTFNMETEWPSSRGPAQGVGGMAYGSTLTLLPGAARRPLSVELKWAAKKNLVLSSVKQC
jgi:hypothetical protein